MKRLQRLFWLLLFIAGVLVAFVYPRVIGEPGGETIARPRVFAADEGSFRPFAITIPEGQAPVRVFVHMTVDGRFQPANDVAVLTLTVASNGRTVIARPLTFTGMPLQQESPQAAEAVYRELAGEIDPLTEAPYIFTVTRGDADGIDIRSVDLVLETAGAPGIYPQPVGYALAALGFICLVLSFRRPRENPNSSPLPQRWGRG